VTIVPGSGRRPGARRRLFPRGLVLALALIAVFVLGLAVGRALEDHPKNGGVVTSVRTLTPLPQQPPTRTVTVTVTQESSSG
jgi:hypothetical protein